MQSYWLTTIRHLRRNLKFDFKFEDLPFAGVGLLADIHLININVIEIGGDILLGGVVAFVGGFLGILGKKLGENIWNKLNARSASKNGSK